MNRTKTVVLLATLTALLGWAGQALGGSSGLVIALIAAAAMNLGAWWYSDRLVLRMYGAQPVSPAEAPELHGIVRDLAARAGLPVPAVYVIPEAAPNAFATGRSPRHAAVAVTEGLLRALDRREVAGVIAHEVAHVQHRDTLVMTVAATLAGAVSMLANLAQWSLLLGGGRGGDESENGPHPATGLLGVLVAPFAAMLVQAAISRSREFLADEGGARLTRDPRGLASALTKLEAWRGQVAMSAASPATAHLFIVNPFAGAGLLALFRTHPTTEARVARLLALEGARDRGPGAPGRAAGERTHR
jgi:heat shock protein HtpX